MSNLNSIDTTRHDSTTPHSTKNDVPDHGDAASRRLSNQTTRSSKPTAVHDDSHHIEFEPHSAVSHMLGSFDFGGPSEHDAKPAEPAPGDAELKPSPDGWKSVKQGDMGDCYFLSAMVDVAKKDPQAIRDLIKQNDNGTYTVNFHGHDPITVDGKGLPNGVQADGKWAQVLEQAWETQLGNVRNGKVDEWGSSGSADALEALTGRKFGERSGDLLQTGLSQELTNDVIKAVREGKEVTAATGGISSLWEGPKDNMVDKHVYSSTPSISLKMSARTWPPSWTKPGRSSIRASTSPRMLSKVGKTSSKAALTRRRTPGTRFSSPESNCRRESPTRQRPSTT